MYFARSIPFYNKQRKKGNRTIPLLPPEPVRLPFPLLPLTLWHNACFLFFIFFLNVDFIFNTTDDRNYFKKVISDSYSYRIGYN